jgi:RNA polymerase sigma factor (sigma-70 family)
MAQYKKGAEGSSDAKRFGSTVMIHLDAAYDLARWLTRDERDAEDVVQEACLRAFRYLDGFRGGNSRAWFLTIVRNTYYSDLKKNHAQAMTVPLDEESACAEDIIDPGALDDVIAGIDREDAKRILREAFEKLPAEYREILVLRELEDLSYHEIARIAQIPIGTVMSRLSRARKLLSRVLHLRSAQA